MGLGWWRWAGGSNCGSLVVVLTGAGAELEMKTVVIKWGQGGSAAVAGEVAVKAKLQLKCALINLWSASCCLQYVCRIFLMRKPFCVEDRSFQFLALHHVFPAVNFQQRETPPRVGKSRIHEASHEHNG